MSRPTTFSYEGRNLEYDQGFYTYREPTLRALHDAMSLSLVTAQKSGLSYSSSVDVARHNVMAQADSMEWSYDIKNLWMAPQRWAMMVKQYLDPVEVVAWIQKTARLIGSKGRGISILRTQVVKPRGGAATGHTNIESRRWGSCMMSISYKATPAKTIVMHSRTSYLGYLSVLDLSIAYHLARYLAHEICERVEDFKFIWMVEAVQYHSFKSLPFLMMNEDPELRRFYRNLLLTKRSQLTDAELELISTPAMKISRDWMDKVRLEDARGVTYGDMNYNSYRRIRRRWHTEVRGVEFAEKFVGMKHFPEGHKRHDNPEWFGIYKPLPHTQIEMADFRAIKVPFGPRYLDGVDLGEPDELEDTRCPDCGCSEDH